jgi:hypothetical protein
MGHRKRGSERRECSHQKRRNFWRGASKIVPFERDKGRAAAAAAASARTSASTLALSHLGCKNTPPRYELMAPLKGMFNSAAAKTRSPSLSLSRARSLALFNPLSAAAKFRDSQRKISAALWSAHTTLGERIAGLRKWPNRCTLFERECWIMVVPRSGLWSVGDPFICSHAESSLKTLYLSFGTNTRHQLQHWINGTQVRFSA